MKLLFLVIIGLLSLIIIKYYCAETFANNDSNLYNIIQKQISEPYYYDRLLVDELSFKLYKKAINDNKLKNIIKTRVFSILSNLKDNEKLRNYLLFNNLINEDNMLIFINEYQENVLLNEIKIILVLMNKNDLEQIKKLL
jgi:hypothetical protein